MAFILKLKLQSNQKYLKNYIASITKMYNISAKIMQKNGQLICAFPSEHTKLQVCLDAIANELPASIFLKGSSNLESDLKIDNTPEIENSFPLSLGLCPSCQKELFDVSSRRYYYPFISCTCCGANHSFLIKYPYERANTSFRFIVPCPKCEEEIKGVGFREKHYINSCHTCGVPVRLLDKKTERYANDMGSFRTMFEVAAKALNDNKKVLIKTTMGYRLFYKADMMKRSSILMMINASKITDHLSLITEEFNSLLSIERPILHVTVKNEQVKKKFNANTAYVKYPDDGFSILLGAELQRVGVDFIAYEDADANYEADILMDYDLEVSPQKDIRLFINKDVQFIAEGERVCFPSENFQAVETLSIAHGLAGVAKEDKMFFDNMDKFEYDNVAKINILEGTLELLSENQKIMAQDEASFISVIAENHLVGRRCVGAYFDEVPSFLYYDGKSVLRVVPPKKFDTKTLLDDMASLREGSDRLVENIKNKMPQMYEKLKALEKRDDVELFEVVAIVLDLDELSMKGVVSEAMKFIGKGGIQMDTHMKDNRFDNVAFVSSIISYQFGDVDKTTLSYSIFESFGDYFSEIIDELQTKTKAEKVILCGSDFANQSLFSRIQKNLKAKAPLMNINYPIGKENAVVGGVFL